MTVFASYWLVMDRWGRPDMFEGGPRLYRGLPRIYRGERAVKVKLIRVVENKTKKKASKSNGK